MNKMDLPFLETAWFWSNIAVVTFGVLAAIAGGAVWYFSSRLDALKDSDFARFKLESTKEIAAANSSAAEANERAKQYESGIATANARAAEAQMEASKANERASDANRIAEGERLER